MGAIANTIAIVVIVCVGYLIIKKVYPTAVLMIAGLVLLCCAVLLDVEPGLAHYVHGRLRQVHGQA